jgi:hypothetical protein
MGQDREEIIEPITCPACRQAGQAVWEGVGILKESLGAARRLLSLTGNFHQGEIRGESGAPLIVCGNCNQTLLG